MFGDSITDEEELLEKQATHFSDMMYAVLQATAEVLERQYKKYYRGRWLPDRKRNNTKEMRQKGG